MRVTPAVAAVLLLLILLTWLSLRSANSDAETFDQQLGKLDDFATLESTLQRDVLGARSGMLHNYDPLVREVDGLNASLDQLRETAAIDADTAAAIDRLAASVARQEDLVEEFKSDNALLQNSLAYFGVFSLRLADSERNLALAPAASAVAAAMLHFLLDTSATAAGEVEGRLDDLARQPAPPDSSDQVQALLAHGRLLHSLLPATDGVLRSLFALPMQQEQEAVRALVLTRQGGSRETARDFRMLLYGTSLLLLGLLVHLGLRLRARALALQQRAALEHVIAGISTRFINAPPQEIGAQIEAALGELAERVGADRAYFVTPGPPLRAHAWSRPGVVYPPGWPDDALAVADRIETTRGGIICIQRVDRLPPGEAQQRLAAARVSSWGGVRSGDGSSILGFDALQARTIGRPGELGLLRMALDAMANAVGRDVLERERARLETRLQQARRLETVGALASGIAHNFNNILGAILGHAEIAEGQLAADSRAVGNIEAIRRAGERARDLVDQILAFGRRRDVRSRPVGIEALVAEVASLLRVSLPPGIELAIRAAPPMAIVSGEPAQLQQVLLNLCNNAAQAMDHVGRVEIETGVHDIALPRGLSHGELRAGRYVRLAVSDAGRGMDAATLERMFEPFFTTRPTGNGLGLATVREIVREHGGAFNVWSAPNAGSRFEAWLPCIAAIGPTPGEDAPTLPLGRGETLLVIDHDHARLLRDEEMLAALGYEPVGFVDPAEALAALRKAPERFDALLVCHRGQVMAALDLLAALHAAAPRLPIVLVTASTDVIDADALLAAGIFEVVRRPLVSTDIAEALQRGLAQRRTARYRRNAMPQH